jgi:putative endonuclease
MQHGFDTRLVTGQQGENQVSRWLERNGYEILQRNYRVRTGEIDIIARKQEVIAFIEVKYRSDHYFSLSEVITPTKQKRIIRAAHFFIAQHPNLLCSYRFDVALVEPGCDIAYIENAFGETSDAQR